MNCFTTSRACIPTIQPLGVVFYYINIYSKPNVKIVLKWENYLALPFFLCTFAPRNLQWCRQRFKNNSIMKKTIEKWNKRLTLEAQIKEGCMDYIKAELAKHDNLIDLSETDGVCVVYDGGNHPEYASNAFSSVYSVFMKDGNIYLETEDCSQYDIDSITLDNLFDVAYCIYSEIEEQA